MILTFDDASVTIYSEAFAYMQTLGLLGTYYCNTGAVVGGGQMTWEQVLEMNAAGWAVCNHSVNGTRLTDVSAAQAEINIAGARDALIAHGITNNPYHIAYVGGSYNGSVITAAQNAGMLSGRTVDGLAYPGFPFANMMTIQGVREFNPSLTLAAAKAYVDLIKTNHETEVFMFHTFNDAGTYSWLTADFQALMDYIVAQGVRVLTMPQAYAEYSGWTNYKY